MEFDEERAAARLAWREWKDLIPVRCTKGHEFEAVCIPAQREGDFAGPAYWEPEECPQCGEAIEEVV